MARCTNCALLNSHCIRNDTNISFFCGTDHCKTSTISFDGAHCKHIRPDERTLGAMIKHALHPQFVNSDAEQKRAFFESNPKRKVLKGVDARNDCNSLCELIERQVQLSSPHKRVMFIVNLTEQGEGIALWLKHQKQRILCCSEMFVLLGDSADIERDVLDRIENMTHTHNRVHSVDINIGNVSLLDSHAIVLFHHYLDTFLEGNV